MITMEKVIVKDDGGVSIKLAPLSNLSIKNKRNRLYQYKKKLRQAEKSEQLKSSFYFTPVNISEETHKLFDPLPDAFFSNLAASIVYRAVIDYENALIDYYLSAEEQKEEKSSKALGIRKFFGSSWYYVLVNIDPAPILAHIEETAKTKFKNGETQRSKRRNFASLD